MLNLIERTVAIDWLELPFDIPNYFYARRDSTWAFTWVRELSHTGFAYRVEYVLNQKSEKLVSKTLLRPKSRR